MAPRNRAAVDRLSDFPDPIIHHILSFVPDMKQIVRTSILSRRWKSLWKSVHNLDFISNSFRHPDAFNNFVLSILFDRDHNIPVQNIRFHSRFPTYRHLVEIVVAYAVRYDAKHLFLSSPQQYSLSYYLLSCTSLTTLEFRNMILSYSALPSNAAILPSLKTLRVESCEFPRNFSDLFASCLNLKTLKLIGCRSKDRSETLKISGSRLENLEILLLLSNEYPTGYGWKIEISAPNLKYFTYSHMMAPDLFFVDRSLQFLERVDIDIFPTFGVLDFSEEENEWLFGNLFQFFQKISNVQHLNMSRSLATYFNVACKGNNPPSPFRRLKSLKLFNGIFSSNSKEFKMSDNARDYFIAASPYTGIYVEIESCEEED